MIPSALDKEDTYSVLIPLKEEPLIHPASDPSSLTIILMAFQNSSFNSSSAQAHAVRMNKQNKTQPEYQCEANTITNGAGKDVTRCFYMEVRRMMTFFFIRCRTVQKEFLLNEATQGYHRAAPTE